MKKNILFLIIIYFLVTLPAFSQKKMRIAVLELRPRGTSEIIAGAVTDIIRSELVKSGRLNIVERTRMDEILKEQGFQMSGCMDQTCAVDVGKLMAAHKVIIGELNKIENTFIITLRIVDVEKGLSEHAADEKTESENMLDKASRNITRKLLKNMIERNRAYFNFQTPLGYYSRSIIPGWGQLYAEREVKGYIFLGSFILAAGFTIYSYLNYKKAANDYNNIPRGSAQSEFDSEYNAKKKAGVTLLISGGILTAVYLVHWVDALFFSKPLFGHEQTNFNKQSLPVTILLDTGTEYNGNKTISFGLIRKF